jgi:hypothetical protein
MLRFWRKAARDPVGEEHVRATLIRDLSPHLLRDLNLPDEIGFFAPDSIRNRKLPPAPSF